MGVKPCWSVAQKKLSMYKARFVAAHKAEHFLTKASKDEVIQALDSDLARFIPQNIFLTYKKENFRRLVETLKRVTQELMDQGMRDYFESDGR